MVTFAGAAGRCSPDECEPELECEPLLLELPPLECELELELELPPLECELELPLPLELDGE